MTLDHLTPISLLRPIASFSRHISWFGVAWLLNLHIASAQTAAAPTPLLKAPKSLVTLTTLQERVAEARQDQAHLVFYRPDQDTTAHPLRIYWAETYHASLFPGMYTELCGSPGPSVVRLMAVLASANWEQPMDAQFAAGQIRYVRVSAIAEQGLRWEEVSAQVAQQEAGAAIPVGFQSRVRGSKACRISPAATTTATPPAPAAANASPEAALK